ncbi:porin [Niveispirillum lacus]|uniref:porin n=1 Tax=Niveispirillum lacus TaxID=1981099 RepID=UPI0013FD3426|nr:porin [Niveispirillum lacus]
MVRLLPCLSAAAALLVALPATADTVAFDWRGVGHGAIVRSGDGHDLYGTYAITGEGTLTTDSGLGLSLTTTLGAGDYQKSLDRPGRNDPLTANEIFLTVNSAWGRLRIGDEDGAAKRATDMLPLLAGGQMDGLWTDIAPTAPPIDHLGRDSDDATKILYETPRVMGLRLGISYAPKRDSLVENIAQQTPGALDRDLWEAGLNYQGDWQALSYELAAGYVTAESRNPLLGDTESLKLAGLLFYGGFSGGVVYVEDGDSGRLKGDEATSTTMMASYENGPYGAALWWQGVDLDMSRDYNAYGTGLSWRVLGETSLSLDAVRYEGGRRGWTGMLGVEARF